VIGSGLAHGTLLVALFAIQASSPIVVPGPEVVQVALVEPTATPTVVQPPPAPPEPEPTPAPEVKPTEEVGVKLTPPPKPPKRPKPKREEPAPVTPAPALPYAAVGNAGLKGQISVDAGDFEFTYYLVLVRNRVAQSWMPPAGLVSRGQPVRAVVYFKIGRGGEVSAVRVESTSGVEFFDGSAVRAVTISDPLPPLPLGFSASELGVHFGFEYAGP
jgi:TonB family protein